MLVTDPSGMRSAPELHDAKSNPEHSIVFTRERKVFGDVPVEDCSILVPEEFRETQRHPKPVQVAFTLYHPHGWPGITFSAKKMEGGYGTTSGVAPMVLDDVAWPTWSPFVNTELNTRPLEKVPLPGDLWLTLSDALRATVPQPREESDLQAEAYCRAREKAHVLRFVQNSTIACFGAYQRLWAAAAADRSYFGKPSRDVRGDFGGQKGLVRCTSMRIVRPLAPQSRRILSLSSRPFAVVDSGGHFEGQDKQYRLPAMTLSSVLNDVPEPVDVAALSQFHPQHVFHVLADMAREVVRLQNGAKKVPDDVSTEAAIKWRSAIVNGQIPQHVRKCTYIPIWSIRDSKFTVRVQPVNIVLPEMCEPLDCQGLITVSETSTTRPVLSYVGGPESRRWSAYVDNRDVGIASPRVVHAEDILIALLRAYGWRGGILSREQQTALFPLSSLGGIYVLPKRGLVMTNNTNLKFVGREHPTVISNLVPYH